MMMKEEIISQLESMRRQESGPYACRDYFNQQRSDSKECKFGTPTPLQNTKWSNKSSSQQSTPLRPSSRKKMIEWCYQIADQCKFERESIAIAISYLDRFLMTKSGAPALYDRKTFQLVAMTCLYTAIKLFEQEVIDPSIVVHLSRGTYTEDDVTGMEMIILSALQWRVQPPTAMAFVGHFLALADVTEQTKNLIMEVARVQVENAVIEHNFMNVKPSMIAAASILNTIHLMDRNSLPDGSRCSLSLVLEQHGSNRFIYGTEMMNFRERLLDTVKGDNEVSSKEQQGTTTACKTSSSTTMSTSVQNNKTVSQISVERGSRQFLDSLVSLFPNVLKASGQFW
mmetsp:Transcript_12126/g.17971  ORF Transcript_12126/g.17971 Transcript_12126/m.17971 type:complete len:341 (-) Transcript_12126:8-1030(-)